MNPCDAKAPIALEATALVRAWLPQQQINVVKSLIKPFFISLSIPVKISVKILRTKQIKEVDLDKGLTVLDLLKKLKLKPDTIIVMNKNLPIPVDDVLKDKQNISIIQVSSGG